jgi:hypothetical protein
MSPSRTGVMMTPRMENREPSRYLPRQSHSLHFVSPSTDEARSSAVKSGMPTNNVDQLKTPAHCRRTTVGMSRLGALRVGTEQCGELPSVMRVLRVS